MLPGIVQAAAGVGTLAVICMWFLNMQLQVYTCDSAFLDLMNAEYSTEFIKGPFFAKK